MKLIFYLVIAYFLISALLGYLSILAVGGIFGNDIKYIFGQQSYSIFIAFLVVVSFGIGMLIKYIFGAINSF